MRKFKLGIENLRVESFATDAIDGSQGTVLANEVSVDPTCETNYPVNCGSAIDACPSSPHVATLPCNGCVETDFC